MYGIIKVGAIDCIEDEELCEEFQIYSYPTLMIFTENILDDGEKYTGKMEWKEITKVTSPKMQNFVSVVTEQNYEEFMKREPTKHKVLVFTQRRSTSPLFKALSKQYKDKLVFGEVRDSEKGLVEKFKI